jgi:hypothetical protein
MTVTKAAMFLIPDGCDLWPPYRCGWNLFEIWRWMSFFQRLDVVVLALLLGYVIVAFIYVTHRIRSTSASATQNDGQARRMASAADVSVWVRTLESIARVAPFFGLAGVCEGIFEAFGPRAGYPRAATIAAALSETLITTAAGLVVAIPAIWSYNHLRWRIDRLGCPVRQARSGGPQVAQALPPPKPFSRLPAFPLVAVPCLGISALAFIALHSAFFFSKGFWVSLSPSAPEAQIVITLRTATADPIPDVYINSKRTTWDDLGTVLQDGLRTSRRVVQVGAQDEVRWLYVAEVIDLAEGLGARVVLQPAQPALDSTK